jgi:nucleoside-diphosphate-sugar epimerase
MKHSNIVVVAGANGRLGGRIVRELLDRGAHVRALIRDGAPRDATMSLQQRGASIVKVDYDDDAALRKACTDASCVVSALAGLRDVIVGRQTKLLEAAVKSRVQRFIPSDYSIDFAKQPAGLNRNLDLRREFHVNLARAPIAPTSILCGAFANMLTGHAPIILFKRRRVVYWEDADVVMDFTTIENTAAFTAEAAMDPDTPRFLRIAGDEVSARDLCGIATEVTGEKFRLLRAGPLKRLTRIIRVARRLFPQNGELYPAWQGMQYMHNMFSGIPKLNPLDNDRYPAIRWTSAYDVLATHHSTSLTSR